MSEHLEIALTTDASGATFTCCAWDTQAGTQLQPYRAGGSVAASAHAVAYLNGRHLVAANASKPLLHIWPVNSQEQVPAARFVTPGRCTALDATPDGNYMIAGIAESVYVWQVCSGQLLAVLARHFSAVTSVRCTSDGSHFISAGRDGNVFVWPLLQVIGGIAARQSHAAQAAPLYSFNDHTLEVTAIHCTSDAMRSHLATVSLDRSCKLYDLASGEQLLSVVFPAQLTAVCIDHLDAQLYVGTAVGDIYSFGLAALPRQREHHVAVNAASSAELPLQRFAGHAQGRKITALSVSLDGETLLSGSEDATARIWDVGSAECVRTLQHKGAVLNAFFQLAPAVMFDAEQRLPLIAGNLKRMLGAAGAEGEEEQVVEVLVTEEDEVEEWRLGGDEELWVETVVSGAASATMGGDGQALETVASRKGAAKRRSQGGAETAEEELERLRAENKSLKQINKKLYQHQVKGVLKK